MTAADNTKAFEQSTDWEFLAEVGVDSGQLFLVDPCYLSMWDNSVGFDVKRQYRHKTTGEVLEYEKDFPHYEAVIKRHGKTMNQLNASGEWDQIEQTQPPGMNYNAVAHATLSKAGGGQVDLGAAFSTGYGDGSYPVFVRRNAEGRIMQVLIDFDLEDDDGDEVAHG